MIKIKFWLCNLVIAILFPLLLGCSKEIDNGQIKLTLGSWRVDDTAQIEALIAEFNKKNPDIEIEFYPINAPDYNATISLQLEHNIAPDIIYSRSYTAGEELYNKGYLLNLKDKDWISNSFDNGALSPWSTSDGNQFAMPLLAVSHGIYYNIDLFSKLGLKVPKSWDELLKIAEAIKKAGIIPFSNGIADQWDIAEVVWMSIAPGIIGGREGRLKYENGEKKFNDDDIESVFKAIEDLKPFLPDDFPITGYSKAQDLFANGQAAMYFDGSWSIPQIKSKNPSFNWSIFTPPPLEGKASGVCFHADAGIAINKNSPNIKKAEQFLEWLSGKEASAFIGNQLPGFFPMIKDSPTLSDQYANAFLSQNSGKQIDVRFTWPRLMSGNPSGYSLILNGSNNVLNDFQTPKEAADSLAEGLAEWYKP